MTEQQQPHQPQAVENNKRRSSSMQLDDSNSNESSGSLNSRSGSSAGSCRSHSSSSVDIETNGSADEGPQQRRSHVDMVAALATVAPVNPPLTVADSLSPAKPALLAAVPAQHQHEAPATSTGNKLSLNHHVSHLYTIEAILGLNNQHPKGINSNSFSIELNLTHFKMKWM